MIQALRNLKSRHESRSLTMVGALVVTVLLPFAGTAISWSLILLLLCWLLDGNWSEKRENFRVNRWYWMFAGLYALACLGYLHSDNKDEASFKLVQKIVLLLLPLCFAASRIAANKLTLVQAFVAALAVNCVMLESRAIWNFLETREPAQFFYDLYCYFLHPSYFALLLSVGLIAALLFGLDQTKPLRERLTWFLIALFFSVNVLQSSSRAGQLGLVFVWLVVGIVFLSRLRTLSTSTKIVIAVIPAVTLLLAFFFSSQSRLTTLRYAQDMDNASKAHAESGQVRLLIWKEAIGLIKQMPFSGYGTGDVSDLMDQRYMETGMTDAMHKHLNVHNQYLQTWLSNGVLAVLLLLGIFVFGLWKGWKQRDYLAIGFFTVAGFNFLFESMLERREGLFAFALLSSLFLCDAKAATKSPALRD